MNIKEIILQDFDERKITNLEEYKNSQKLMETNEKLFKLLDEEQKKIFFEYESLIFEMIYFDKLALLEYCIDLFGYNRYISS